MRQSGEYEIMTKISLHRFAGLPQRFLVSLGLGMGLLTFGALAPLPSATQDAPQPQRQLVATRYGNLLATVNTNEILVETAKETAPDTITITLYTPTAICEGFQTEEKAIVEDKAIPQIVHFLIADQTSNLLDFELAGYRIQPGEKGNSITIDFRRKPDAQRHFISLSMCEQLALFGSLRKTLLENPALDIDSVRFTERGRLIQI